ncbi:hypothetical protein [Candidatus Macondimonas diazotrophica]|uniref:Uncharacterized protein n=1 Tax=Candidatus Macondimonas diazotrophica TaxID=2305248 RepID=A0A4Z0FBJ7_9GAMM|nr:hypothetical protein [Candidatus Macondimonas diazotrophica]NCU01488.1 hypothetical protein [Candidatus Macondimonas diazotrophica]TFZ83086.1 hypothetical protein E4680_05490 [Candidatus Macondimonas diazotrophica]HBG29980.1 hypothetical protein [Gammaproteobacteria bacterium]
MAAIRDIRAARDDPAPWRQAAHRHRITGAGDPVPGQAGDQVSTNAQLQETRVLKAKEAVSLANRSG